MYAVTDHHDGRLLASPFNFLGHSLVASSMTVRGDREFVEFVEATSTWLLRAAYLLTGDHHQAEDDV